MSRHQLLCSPQACHDLGGLVKIAGTRIASDNASYHQMAQQRLWEAECLGGMTDGEGFDCHAHGFTAFVAYSEYSTGMGGRR